jgi:hypothetical protein
MRLITQKKFKKAKNKKDVGDALETLVEGSRKIFKKICIL